MVKIPKNYNGCPKQPDDHRDIKLGDVPFIPDPNCPSYDVGFSNEKKHGLLKRNHQGFSLSCVGQGWSKYLEMLEQIENKIRKELSPKSIYSNIALIKGGAYVRDGAKFVVDIGCGLEITIPSVEPGKPTETSEEFMRDKSWFNGQMAQIMATYKSKKFVYVDTTFPFTEEDWENMRQVIWQYRGFVSGWSGHCVYAEGYGKKDGKRFIHFINSYGEGSDWYLWEGDTDYKYYNASKYRLYDITFLLDLPNPPSKIFMLKIVGNKKDKKQYAVGADGKLRHIFNPVLLDDLHAAGVVNKSEVEWRDNLDGFEIVDPWAVIKSK